MRSVTFKDRLTGARKQGFFHQWGYESAESANGNIQWSVGIIEDLTGKVILVLPEELRFVSDDTEKPDTKLPN